MNVAFRLEDSGPDPGEPPGWWGPVWAASRPRSLVELVRGGVMDAKMAAGLWTLVEAGHSLTVAAGPSGAGKTTLLTSLLDALPPQVNRYYVRGLYEQFEHLRAHPAGNTVLLVNEISPHLPIYAWGDVVRDLLDLSSDGYQVLATIHARSVEEIVGQLSGYPLRLPPRLIAQLGTVVFLGAWEDEAGIHRRVETVKSLKYDDGEGALNVEDEPFTAIGGGLICRRAKVIDRFVQADHLPAPRELIAAMQAVR